MSKCKNCIHYEVCDHYCVDPNTYEELDLEERDGVEDICFYFKDESLFVELPCKVGDYVYRITGENTTKPWVWHWEIVEIMIYQDEIVYRDDSDNIIENKDFGKTVFLTKEEAEAKLKELEK